MNRPIDSRERKDSYEEKEISKNRPIKFRAWDEVLARMEYQPDVSCSGGEDFYINSAFDGYNAERLAFMQFTGLIDKNGKEIYEGDILIENDGSKVKVVWFNSAFWFMYNESDGYTYDWAHQHDEWGPVEIIGNIYENSDLLA